MGNSLECAICFERFALSGERTPKVLPCQHSFCLQCLEDGAQDGRVYCQTCRRTWDVADVGGLPDDDDTMRMIEEDDKTPHKSLPSVSSIIFGLFYLTLMTGFYTGTMDRLLTDQYEDYTYSIVIGLSIICYFFHPKVLKIVIFTIICLTLNRGRHIPECHPLIVACEMMPALISRRLGCEM